MRALLEKLALNDTSGATPSKHQLFPAAPSPNVAFPYLPMPFYEMQTQKVTIRIPFFHLIEKKILPWNVCVVISSRTQHIAKISIWHLPQV